MSDLTVRSPKFPIDETVPFQWQPANPTFGLFGNTFTFLAIAFERYIISATRPALPRFTDADMAEEADVFVRQEAQHARAHRAHAKAMIECYPGLQETYAAANAAYDQLLERERHRVPPGLHRQPRGHLHALVQDGTRQPPRTLRGQ